MLSRLLIKNFKSIGEKGIDIELKPLVILVGPQASGKSNIIEALWRFSSILGRSIFKLGEIEPLKCEFKDLIFKKDLKRKLTIGVFIPYEGKQCGWKIEALQKRNKQLVTHEILSNNNTLIKLGFDENLKTVLYYSDLKLEYKINIDLITYHIFEGKVKVKIKDIYDKIVSNLNLSKKITEKIYKELRGFFCLKVAFLSSLRGEIPSLYDVKEEIRIEDELKAVGLKGEKLITFLSLLSNLKKYKEYWEYIVKWCNKFELIDIHSKYSSISNKVFSEYKDKVLEEIFNLAFASFGSRQILTIIAQIFSPYHKIILIEEPEISLHPKNIALLPLLFYDSIKLGKQIIITTHSTILPISLKEMVKKAFEENFCKNPNELISIYEIEKLKEGTVAKRLYLNDKGYIKENIFII